MTRSVGFLAAATGRSTPVAPGYAGFRTAVRRAGEPPYRGEGDDAGDSRSRRRARTDGPDPSSAGTSGTPAFTRTQRVRGLVLLGAFVVVRAVAARAWDRYFPGGYSTDPLFLGFLGGIFLLFSAGIAHGFVG